MNQLCRHRLHKARTTHSPDFSLSEVRDAISELKQGRCIDPTVFVREICTRAGAGLVQSIMTMLNMIKKKWQVPSRWAEMYICIFLLLACVSIRANTKPKARRYARPKGGHYEGRGLCICLYSYASQLVRSLLPDKNFRFFLHS